MSTSEIRIPSHDGGMFKAYVAMPDITPAPAVIMIQEIFGVNDEMRKKCDDMAAKGYMAVCPDLFWRIDAGIELSDDKDEEVKRAFELFEEFDVNDGMADLKTTLGYVRHMKECNEKVGTVGYCLGGKLAYMMRLYTDVDAAVGYYGVEIQTMLDEPIEKPLMLHIAEEDEFTDKDAQEKIKNALGDNPMVILCSYPGVGHAFARGKGQHHDDAAAGKANARTEKFLEDILKP